MRPSESPLFTPAEAAVLTRLSLKAARDNAFKIDWKAHRPVKPTFLGPKAFESYDLAELVLGLL